MIPDTDSLNQYIVSKEKKISVYTLSIQRISEKGN